MTDSPKHSPTPWEVHPTIKRFSKDTPFEILSELSGYMLAELVTQLDPEACEANGRFIVRAVNSHDALVSALRDIVSEFGRDDYPKHSGMSLVYLRAAREALKNAGEA